MCMLLILNTLLILKKRWNNTPLDEAILHKNKVKGIRIREQLQTVVDLLQQHIDEYVDTDEDEEDDYFDTDRAGDEYIRPNRSLPSFQSPEISKL